MFLILIVNVQESLCRHPFTLCFIELREGRRIKASKIPPEFFPAEIIIPGKDKPETGIPVNLRHGNFRRKAEITETFSGGNFFVGKFQLENFPAETFRQKLFAEETFQTENFSTGNFPRKTNRFIQEQIFPLNNNSIFSRKNYH